MIRMIFWISGIGLSLVGFSAIFCACAAPPHARLFADATPQFFEILRQERIMYGGPGTPFRTKSTLYIYQNNSYILSSERFYHGRTTSEELKGSFSIHSDTLLCYTDKCDCKYKLKFKDHHMSISSLGVNQRAGDECNCPPLTGGWH